MRQPGQAETSRIDGESVPRVRSGEDRHHGRLRPGTMINAAVDGAQGIRADDGDRIEVQPPSPTDALKTPTGEPVARFKVLRQQLRAEGGAEDLESRTVRVVLDAHACDCSVRFDAVDESQGSHGHSLFGANG